MYNKPAKIDTTVKLWDYLYKVRVPYLASRTVEDVREKGVVVTGIPEIDNDIQNQLLTTYISIAKMSVYFNEGIPIKLCDPKDARDIYESISLHIHSWKAQLERGINIGDAPIDDLILLDRFANSIYEHGKFEFTKDVLDSLMGKHMTGLQRVSAANFFKSGAMDTLKAASETGGVTKINEIKEDTPPDRDSLAEFFKTRLMNNKRW